MAPVQDFENDEQVLSVRTYKTYRTGNLKVKSENKRIFSNGEEHQGDISMAMKGNKRIREILVIVVSRSLYLQKLHASASNN